VCQGSAYNGQPIVLNDVPGALEIQEALEFSEMVSEAGLSPALWSRYLRQAPLPGSLPKSVVYLFAHGDRTSVNPGTTLLLRAGNLADLINTLNPNLLTRTVALNGQEWIGMFIESDGTAMNQPLPANLFEMPILGPLPEVLNFIR
jgi:hypothetical protein